MLTKLKYDKKSEYIRPKNKAPVLKEFIYFNRLGGGGQMHFASFTNM